jgi:hypothetical protein
VVKEGGRTNRKSPVSGVGQAEGRENERAGNQWCSTKEMINLYSRSGQGEAVLPVSQTDPETRKNRPPCSVVVFDLTYPYKNS